MLRRYIAGFIAMRYVPAVSVLAAAALMLMFIGDRLLPDGLRYVIPACAAAVMVILIMYVRDRERARRQLSGIKNQDEYEHAVVLGYVFFLENRAAAYAGGDVIEDDYAGITDAEQLTGKKDKPAVRLTIKGKIFDAQTADPQQAELLAAFLKKKNPQIRLHNLEAVGPGTWKSIDQVQTGQTAQGG